MASWLPLAEGPVYMGFHSEGSQSTTRTFSLLLLQLGRQQSSLKQVDAKQHLNSGLTSGTKGKRKMNLEKVVENLPPSLLTPFHQVSLLFKNSPPPSCHHHPVGTQNYPELTGVNVQARKVNLHTTMIWNFQNYSSQCLFSVYHPGDHYCL